MTKRLLLSYLTVTLVVLLLLEIPLAFVFQQREMDQLARDVERDASVLATLYEDSLERGSPFDPDPARDYAATTNGRVVVVDQRGISRLDTAGEVPRDFSTRPEFEIALSGARATGTRFSETVGSDLLYVAVPVASGGNIWGAVRVTLDRHEVKEIVYRFWLGLVAIGLVVLVVAAGIGWAIARSVTRPVRRLHEAAQRFSGGDLTQTEHDPDAPPELAELEAAMNAMAQRLDALLGRQRAFVADASHQLRTPLTALRLRLENLQSDVETPEHVGELEGAIEETRRLAALVGQLLALAKAEEPAAAQAFDVARLTAERVDTWSAVADQERMGLDLVGAEGHLWVRAVPGAIEQILDNLLDNAITAAPADSTIVVRVDTVGDRRVLSIADEGPGLDDSEKALAVERFWRAGESTTGTGLGLAIVRSLAAASGGGVELSDNKPHGLVVSVSFPIADPAQIVDHVVRQPGAVIGH